MMAIAGCGLKGSAPLRLRLHRPRLAERAVDLDALAHFAKPDPLGAWADDDWAAGTRGDIRGARVLNSLAVAHRSERPQHYAAEHQFDPSIPGPEGSVQTTLVQTHQLVASLRARQQVDPHLSGEA